MTRDRLLGFRDAAHRRGLAWADVSVAVCARNDEGEAHGMTRALLAIERPLDGLAAMSDQQAHGIGAPTETGGGDTWHLVERASTAR
ncbi:hypothetical protein [Actinotalea sp. C106]|uniref:hypothetical protein n=1 Tax=Actinotalea sp. C106 TaxID=2908644 RepID=UPI00202953E0|nr:hypothetical protein [Actinotalea sp. C106]